MSRLLAKRPARVEGVATTVWAVRYLLLGPLALWQLVRLCGSSGRRSRRQYILGSTGINWLCSRHAAYLGLRVKSLSCLQHPVTSISEVDPHDEQGASVLSANNSDALSSPRQPLSRHHKGNLLGGNTSVLQSLSIHLQGEFSRKVMRSNTNRESPTRYATVDSPYLHVGAVLVWVSRLVGSARGYGNIGVAGLNRGLWVYGRPAGRLRW